MTRASPAQDTPGSSRELPEADPGGVGGRVVPRPPARSRRASRHRPRDAYILTDDDLDYVHDRSRTLAAYAERTGQTEVAAFVELNRKHRGRVQIWDPASTSPWTPSRR